MIHWGILGAGNIAHRFAKSLSLHNECELTAFSCRNEEKAKAFIKAFPCQTYYAGGTCHDDLLNDPTIDAIYLCLPHGLHAEWAIKALNQGKAVLCEKPAVISAEEMEAIKEAALKNQRLFVEGMKSRFLPCYRKVKELVKQGEIGRITRIDADQCRLMPQERLSTTYLLDSGQGGITLDTGCYCLTWLEDFLDGDIVVKKVRASFQSGADAYAKAWFEIGGIPATMEAGWDRTTPNAAVLHGERGEMDITPVHRPTHISIKTIDGSQQELELPYDRDDFYSEIDEVVTLLNEGKIESEIMSLDDSIREAKLNDMVREQFHPSKKDIEVLFKQEQNLQYKQFTNQDALALGNKVIELDAHYDRPISAAIYREPEGLPVFLHLMDGKSKRNIEFMEGKRKVLLETGHSSLYAYLDHAVNGSSAKFFEQWPPYMPSGGAFPIHAAGEHVATLMVSGIHEGYDHDLIIEALSQLLETSTEPIACAIQ